MLFPRFPQYTAAVAVPTTGWLTATVTSPATCRSVGLMLETAEYTISIDSTVWIYTRTGHCIGSPEVRT